jgi:cytochrome c peroxidase
MKRVTLVGSLLIFTAAVVAAVLLFSRPVEQSKMAPPYNPYPPGILPSNLVSEIARVRREVASIENEALAQWRALPPPVLSNTQGAGNPPTLQGTGMRANQLLGKLMNFDESISPFKDRACAFCHMPYTAFSGPIPSVNLTMIAYPGSFEFRAGKRTPQRYTYAPFFPVLNYNETQGLFFGGNFWDSRATGSRLGSPDAEQAQHPPVDTQEHMLADTACVAFRLSTSVYRPLFELVWGGGSLDIAFPRDTETICATPGGNFPTATPIHLSPGDRTKANTVYDRWGQSLDQYEASPDVDAFSSKFDAYLKGTYKLTADEMAGLALFNGKANCNSCHLNGRGTTLPASLTDNSKVASVVPKFTCFGSANEGLPLNPRDAIYYQTTPDAFGFTGNPYGFGYRDLGMGTFLRSGFGSAPNPNSNWTQYAPTVDGQMQVSTARNVAMTPTQCPTTEAGSRPYFQKGFFHNGYIKSLKQLVHFYNTRDKYAYNVTSGHCPPGTVERVTCWPRPEVKNNIDTTTGNLGLTDQEENQIVAFLQALTDGFTRPYPDRATFTGACMICDPATNPNCSPSRQGNDTLIPTPPLPPCVSGICGVAPVPNPPITAAAGGLRSSNPRLAQGSPTAPNVASIRITQGPELELGREHLTVIRWTTDTPGGSPVHYGVVYYGTDPKNLSQTAKSPIRLDPDHSSTIFRVRLDDLEPRTTYYYTVGSMEANGTDDRTKSTVKQFTTP